MYFNGATSPLGKRVGQRFLGQVSAKQDDTFSTMWSLLVSTDKFCQVTSLSIENLTTTSCCSSWLEALCQLPSRSTYRLMCSNALSFNFQHNPKKRKIKNV